MALRHPLNGHPPIFETFTAPFSTSGPNALSSDPGGVQGLLPTPPMSVPLPPMMPGMVPLGSVAPVPFSGCGTITTNARGSPTPDPPQPPPHITAPIIHHKPYYKKYNRYNDKNKFESREHNENNKDLTTVFVGNITERASDSLVRQILMKCGPVVSWKRVQGASGRLQAFGFCEYETPDDGLRALRLLNGLVLGEKTLLVKVDSKTRTQLDEYKKKKLDEHTTDVDADEEEKDYDVEQDVHTKAKDEYARDLIKSMLRENADILSGKYEDSLPFMRKSHSGSAENLEGLDMDNSKKDLVSKEIRSFRQTYRDEEKDKERKEREREREKERDRDRRDRERRREREREERRKEREREEEEDSNRRKRREEEPSDDEKKEERRQRTQSESVERGVNVDRSRERESSSRNREETDDDDYDKRRLERKRREKDNAYMGRLKEWEARERKKTREYEKQFAKDSKKRDEEEEERIHLQEFLEDYDDERDDPKYYRGSALARRMRDREMEIDADTRDKQREMEEIDEILKKRMTETGVDRSIDRGLDRVVERVIERPDKENQSPAHVPHVNLKRDRERSPERLPILKNTSMKNTFTAVKVEARSPSPDLVDGDSGQNSPIANIKKEMESEIEPAAKKKSFGFGKKYSNVSHSSKKLESVFNSNEDERNSDAVSKKKLSRLDDEEEKINTDPTQMSAEEKKKTIRGLIEKIPTAKDELFAYELKWDMVDQPLVEKRIRPWVNKKIFEYIGEEEQTLVEFICGKVIAKTVAKNILEDVAMVLDEEAEVFVVKMWRLLIYETEAKHLGLVK